MTGKSIKACAKGWSQRNCRYIQSIIQQAVAIKRWSEQNTKPWTRRTRTKNKLALIYNSTHTLRFLIHINSIINVAMVFHCTSPPSALSFTTSGSFLCLLAFLHTIFCRVVVLLIDYLTLTLFYCVDLFSAAFAFCSGIFEGRKMFNITTMAARRRILSSSQCLRFHLPSWQHS